MRLRPDGVKHRARKRVKSRHMSGPVDPTRCPLCGASNACGMAAGKGTCWCMALKIPPEVLERVPVEAQKEACICERCAAGASEGAGTKRALRVSG